MAHLHDYRQFNGRHWETGTVHNFYAYRGVTAPHTGEPYSEALLLGVSGGAVMGYFSFAYEGYDPMVRLLTRNTFDPLETMLSRLGVVQHRLQTAKPARGVQNLVETLAEGVPAIVWADYYSLPYNAVSPDAGMWAMFPIVVFGYDETAATAHIADRAQVPLTITTDQLHAARARVNKDKFRVLTLDPPQPEKLAGAVQAGIWDCIKLYTEKPPKGSRNNFGLAAYEWWIKLLTQPKTRMSWNKEFPPGRKLFAGLTSAFESIHLFGEENGERERYAVFLAEAAVLLERPALQEVAHQFRASAAAWRDLGQALLPADVPILHETRTLLWERKQRFVTEGNAALPRMQAINARLDEIKTAVETDFPLDAAGVDALHARIADRVQQLHDVEATAVTALRDAMA